jgi:hypothetical protein
VFLSTESTGQFLYVINFNSSQPDVSSVESFQIDPVNLDLIPSSSGVTQLPGLFLSGATHPSGKSFYALLNIPNSLIPSQAVFLLFDGSTGAFTTLANAFGCCFAFDPQGKSLALEVSSLFTLYSLQADGTLAPNPATVSPNGALSMAFDTFGRFLYARHSGRGNVTVTNAGTAPLHITNVAVVGPNTNDFGFSGPACNSAIPVNASCTITVTFTPLAAGLRTTSLTLTDDAPGSPQVISVKGNASAAPAPAVAVNPSSPDFGTTTQGTSTPMNVTVKNTGTAALHITSVVLGGANGSEFSFSDPACNAAIPVSSTCTIALTFTPFSVGAHVASLTLTDDAPDSPQSVQVKGNANAAFSAGAAQGSSMTASISAGQTAQYQMQLTPGPGYSGSVSLACSGAPLGATCQVPASVSIANGLPAPFTVTVLTSGGAMLPPSIPMRFIPPGIRVLLLLALALVLLKAIEKRRWIFDNPLGPRRLAWSGALAAILLCSVICAAGCGAGSTTVAPPPPIVTPPGTSTITITMSAMSSSGKPLQLQPLQLTLTVK